MTSLLVIVARHQAGLGSMPGRNRSTSAGPRRALFSGRLQR
jgi:hypothetical protein